MLLPISSTWDGQPIGPAEQAMVRIGHAGGEWTIEVEAPFHDDAAPERAAGSCPRLWEHEVVECFLVGEDERYLEIEVGPHGHYLLLALGGSRNVVSQGMAARYQASIDRTARRWRGGISLAEELVPRPLLRVNAFALHGEGPLRRYLCFSPLPGERPDFHQIGRFPAFSAPSGAAGGAYARGD